MTGQAREEEEDPITTHGSQKKCMNDMMGLDAKRINRQNEKNEVRSVLEW